MTDKRDLAVLQFIAVVVILTAASWPEIRHFLSHIFPYAAVVIPAGMFVLLYQTLSFIYTHYLWKLHPGTTYLGGQWIYRTNKKKDNKKQTDSDPASLDLSKECFYGIFEVIHTADKLFVANGKGWYCNEAPSFENTRVMWNSSTIVQRDNMLWVVAGDIATDEPNRTGLTQLLVLTVKSKTEMEGTVRSVADPDEYVYGLTKMIKISNRPRGNAAQEAYRIFGSS